MRCAKMSLVDCESCFFAKHGECEVYKKLEELTEKQKALEALIQDWNETPQSAREAVVRKLGLREGCNPPPVFGYFHGLCPSLSV